MSRVPLRQRHEARFARIRVQRRELLRFMVPRVLLKPALLKFALLNGPVYHFRVRDNSLKGRLCPAARHRRRPRLASAPMQEKATSSSFIGCLHTSFA